MANATLIGNGEAGKAFDLNGDWQAYDVIAGRSKSASLADALRGVDRIISVVTADQSLSAAKSVAGHIVRDALFFDMNSVAPDTKRQAASIIDGAGGRYVDVAVLSPVHPQRRGVPLLVAGPFADAGAAALAELGFSKVSVAGNEVGKASAIKMIRSVMVKGIEALTDEMMAAAEKAGVADQVLASLDASEKTIGWQQRAAYNRERMATHGLRRAAEMEETVKTLKSLGVEPLMTRGTVVRQRNAAKQKD